MKNKLNILIAPLHYCPNPHDGSEYSRAYDYLVAISKNKSIRGDVLVAYMQEKKMGNLHIHSMFRSEPQYISIFHRIIFIIWVYIKGQLLVTRNRYDLLWHNGPFAIGETFNMLALRTYKKIPTVVGPIVAPHTYLAVDEGRSMGRKNYSSNLFLNITRIVDSILYKFNSLAKGLSNKTLKTASLVIAKDNAAYEILSTLDLENLTQLTIGTNVEAFHSKPRILSKQSKYIVVSVGYLVSRKDFITVIKAFNHLVNVIKYRAAELHIIGEGPESNKLKQLVKKYRLSNFIKFIGQVPKHDISTYYKDSNLFVSGSLSESMPAMYLEAMAASLPMVIASNTTSLELERNNFGGTVFPQKNAISMADNIHLLLTNPDLYNSYSIRNYSLSKSKYNFKKQLNKLTDLLYSTVGMGKYENH